MSTDNQRAVSELLRSADKAIKDGNLDNALAAISKVFEFDQRNVYARAYQERILSLKEMRMATRENAEKIPSDSAKHVQESNFAQPEAVARGANAAAPALTRPAPVPPRTSSPAAYDQPPVSVSRTVPAPQPAPAPAAPEAHSQPPVPAQAFEYMQHAPARLKAYRTLLSEIWTVGTFTDAEQQRISAVRQSFAITDQEHNDIERDIRFTAYLAAIELAWKKGVTSFDEMRKQFRISDQEHLQIEGRVFRLLQSLRSVGTVLLIDDDPEFLRLASRQLTEGGFYCVSVSTCEEALFVLESLSPNVVVCDVNFSKPNMSGFAFYEKFRSIDKFFQTPFIFLSGMVQEAVQRTGMQMGADSYFTKPIDLELFLATIEGKIKRSSELQQRMSPYRL